MTTTEIPVHVDLFPARAMVNETTYDKARVIATIPGTIEIWVETTRYPHEVSKAFEATIDEVIENTASFHFPRHRQHLTVRIGDQSVIHVQALNGCGCGSRLRQLPNQSRPATSTADDQLMAALRSHFPNADF